MTRYQYTFQGRKYSGFVDTSTDGIITLLTALGAEHIEVEDTSGLKILYRMNHEPNPLTPEFYRAMDPSLSCRVWGFEISEDDNNREVQLKTALFKR